METAFQRQVEKTLTVEYEAIQRLNIHRCGNRIGRDLGQVAAGSATATSTRLAPVTPAQEGNICASAGRDAPRAQEQEILL